MIEKTNTEEFENYLIDASNLPGGHARKLFIPETAEEISEILKEADREKIPVTVSGARTGTVGGAIPFGGYVISMERFNRILDVAKDESGGGSAVVQAGVLLTDFQKTVESHGLFYPPDPTEWSCQIGGTVATNASGARSFKYGATRQYVERLQVVLPTGEILNLKRGEHFADGELKLPLGASGETKTVKLPSYVLPDTRKNASGYYNHEKLDAVDLFIGSEGTLGVITEIELKLLPKPKNFLSGIVFFKNEKDLLNFVREARAVSFQTRSQKSEVGNQKSELQIPNPKSQIPNQIDASLIEYFDSESLKFIKEKFSETPDEMAGAIFFEQETTAENEDELFEQWNDLLEKHHVEIDVSWFTTTDADREKMRAFRHQLPVSVNEWIVRHKQRKISTDIAVPDENFANLLKFYQMTLKKSGLSYVIFGHIGDNHLHVNILPKTDAESATARSLYGRFIAQGIMLGGAVSAEHGIGKVKRKYLYAQYGERYLNEMGELKRAFDPHAILGRDNIFEAKYVAENL